MVNYQKAKVKITITQLSKLKSAIKNGTALLKIIKKKFQDDELPHELFLTTRQKTKITNAFANNISADVKVSKAWISKII